MEEEKELLENTNIKPSIARVKVLEYLRNNKTHPTVEEIYTSLAEEIPTLSKTTVYNTLELFENNGLARIVNVGENESRYDADISNHGHFKCDGCGRVYDFRVNMEALETRGLEGYKIWEKHLYYRGICSRCRD